MINALLKFRKNKEEEKKDIVFKATETDKLARMLSKSTTGRISTRQNFYCDKFIVRDLFYNDIPIASICEKFNKGISIYLIDSVYEDEITDFDVAFKESKKHIEFLEENNITYADTYKETYSQAVDKLNIAFNDFIECLKEIRL